MALREIASVTSVGEAKRNLSAAIECVAQSLGNTAAVCRNCYVHPDVVAEYLDGDLIQALASAPKAKRGRSLDGLAEEEAAVLALLKAHVKRRRRSRGRTSPAA
jgi:DNA topoisomerase-1